MVAAADTQTLPVGAALKTIHVQCAGPHFQKLLSRLRNGVGGDGVELIVDSDEVVSDEKFEIDIDITYLRSLDPKEWKEQDHYRVLGIRKLR